MKKRGILCDIDNTLAIRGNRDIYDFKNAAVDKINKPVKKIIELFYSNGYEIILISGRESKYSKETKQWLQDKKVPYNKIYFREDGDYRGDEIIKKKKYEKYIEGKLEILFVLEDRNKVVDMWRKELNLTCLQVDYGNF